MSVYQQPMPENPGNPYRLGRNLELDSDSLKFLAPQVTTIKPVDHPSPIPILDQGQLGSCTGNAGTRHVAQLYGADYTKVALDKHTLNGDASNDEQFAIALYHEATVKDGYPGVYPPDDTGSSGLGVCKALKAAGLVSKYTWATTLRSFASMLQSGSVAIGMPWYEAFFSPDPHGFIDTPNWQSSQIAGGHEIYVRGIEAWDDHDPTKVVFTLDNSWNTSWGDHGSFRFRGSLYAALRSQIDIKQAVR